MLSPLLQTLTGDSETRTQLQRLVTLELAEQRRPRLILIEGTKLEGATWFVEGAVDLDPMMEANAAVRQCEKRSLA